MPHQPAPTRERKMEEVITWTLIWYLGVFPALALAPRIFSCCRRWLRACSIRSAARSPTALEANATASAAAAKLEAAEQAKKRLHARVSGGVWQAGWMICHLAFIPYYSTNLSRFGVQGPATRITQVVGSYPLHLAYVFFGVTLVTLSIAPTEAKRIRSVLHFWILFSGLWVALLINAYQTLSQMGAWWHANLCLPHIVAMALVMATQVHSLYGHRFLGGEPIPPRRQLKRLWLSARLMFLELGIGNTVGGVFRCTCYADFLPLDGSVCYLPAIDFVIAGIGMATPAIVTTPALRGRFTRWLGSLGKSGTAEQQAASVASLLGDTGVAKALADGAQRFRAQPLSTLTRAALMDSKPDPSLNAGTVPAKLGEVHAFMSHSWSDDGSRKFDALHEWAGGDHKLIWLDKVRT